MEQPIRSRFYRSSLFAGAVPRFGISAGHWLWATGRLDRTMESMRGDIDDFRRERRSARDEYARYDRAGRDHGMTPLARDVVAHVTSCIASATIPGNGERDRTRWAQLVTAASAMQPRRGAGERTRQGLGFLEVPAGGLRALAPLVFDDAPSGAGRLKVVLDRWESIGLVRRFDAPKRTRHAAAVGFQVVPLTEALLWTAEHRSAWFSEGDTYQRSRRAVWCFTDPKDDALAPPKAFDYLLHLTLHLGPPFVPPTVRTLRDALVIVDHMHEDLRRRRADELCVGGWQCRLANEGCLARPSPPAAVVRHPWAADDAFDPLPLPPCVTVVDGRHKEKVEP